MTNKYLQMAELCLATVRQDALALRNVPVEQRTETLCLAAVRQDGMALRDAPTELRTAAVERGLEEGV
jgi:hypothetical protein